MYHADGYRNDRATCSCKRRSGKSKTGRKNKNIVKNDIPDTAGKRTCHCDRCRIVISGKCRDGIIRHKERCSYEDDTQVGLTKCNKSGIRAEQCQTFIGNKNSKQDERNADQYTPGNCLCKIVIRFFAFCFADAISGRGADTDHRTNCIDETIHGQDQIQDCQSVCPGINGDKKSVCQNIDGNTDHARNTLECIFGKSF